MMASDDNGLVDGIATTNRTALSRYDVVLAVIPAAFLLAALASQLLPVAPRTMLVGAAAVGLLALVDAMFVNPPQPGSRTQ